MKPVAPPLNSTCRDIFQRFTASVSTYRFQNSMSMPVHWINTDHINTPCSDAEMVSKDINTSRSSVTKSKSQTPAPNLLFAAVSPDLLPQIVTHMHSFILSPG